MRAWIRDNLKTRQDGAGALTALIPLALVAGRSPADIVLCFAVLLFLIDSFIRREWQWAKQPWVISLLCLWFYGLMRSFFVPDMWDSLFGAFTWLRYILFAANMASWSLATERNRRWLMMTCLGASVFLSADGVMQYIFGYDLLGHRPIAFRLTGIYSRPILGVTIAGLCAAPLFWLVELKLCRQSLLMGLLCFAAIFLSGDRMGLVFAGGIFLVWVFALLQSEKTGKSMVLIAPLLLGVILWVAAPQMIERQVQSTAQTAQNFNASAYGMAWKSALDIGEAYPVFGVGIRQFRNICPEERFGALNAPDTGYSRCYPHPHNVYLEWFAEGGVIGLIGFVCFVILTLVELWRRLMVPQASFILWGLSVTLVMRLIPVFVSSSFFNNWEAIPFWLAMGWAMSFPVLPKKPA